MLVIDTIRAYLVGSESVISECRRCGTSVNNDTDRCPSCDSREIARYNVA